MTQQEIADVIGRTKSIVSQYEKGDPELPVTAARKIIAAAADRGIDITFDDLYAGCAGALARAA